MRKLIESRHYLRQNMIFVIAISLTLYFSYHLVAGPRGYFKLQENKYQISLQTQSLKNLQTQREAIEKKVVMMRPGSIDRDLLEERVRFVLGYTTKEEYILLQNRS